MAFDESPPVSVRVDDVVESPFGMVVAAHPQAAAAGARILAQGGNAIDAAVGTAFALAVVEPEASGLGGGGFLLFYDAEAQLCASLDYRETAPRLSADAMYAIGGPGMPGHWAAPETEQESAALQKIGGQAVGVPRMVAGLLKAHALYGRLPLADVLEPAIRLAEDGFTVSDALYNAVLNVYDALIADDAMAAAFLDDYLPYEPGATARRPDLAETFRRIAAGGADAFYRGEIAADIVRAVQDAGGILDAIDLESVNVEVCAPLETAYRGMRLVTPAPPAGGSTVFETLAILEGFDFAAPSLAAADMIHLIAEATKRALADRAAYVGDPAFVDAPIDRLIGIEWAAARRATIDPQQATPFPEPGIVEPSSTTHVSVVDAEGNAVSLTQSINLFFGSRVFAPESGILMNDTMADFDPEPGGPNSVQPGKIPVSSMSPLFLFDAHGLRAVLGTPGGIRIASTLVELIVDFVDRGVTLSDAIDAPRFHAESDTLYVESRFPDDVLDVLEARGHPIEMKAAYDLFFGGAHVIEVRGDGSTAMYVGVADPRRAGQAAGL
jgi:gamma-glutamyltranspeptidase/glutathione hydrolase